MAPSSERPPLIGAVLAGGRSSRFGSDKALAPAGETTMGALVVAALRSAQVDPVVAIGGDVGWQLGVPTVPDRWPGQGPLAAVATATLWARRGSVLVVPCDLPLLKPQDVALITAQAAAHPGTGVAATVEGERQQQLTCLPAGWGHQLRDLVASGERRLDAVFQIGSWTEVEVSADSVADADTSQALTHLLHSPRSD